MTASPVSTAEGQNEGSQAIALLPAAALALALLLPLSSLSPFGFGYWEKAEPMVFWFHATGALASLAIIANLLYRPEATWAVLRHPFLVLPLSLALWSCLTAPFAALPMLSLLGAPQSSFGALWFIDLAALIGCAALVVDQRRLWSGLVTLAILVTLVVAGLKAWDWATNSVLLIAVAAYYGWIGLALIPASLPLWASRAGRISGWIALAASIMVAIASKSITVGAAMGFGLMLVGAGTLVRRRLGRELLPRPTATALVACGALLPLPLLQFIPALRHIESLRDRFLLQRMIGASLADTPFAWLVGKGWGHTQNGFAAYLTASGESLWNSDWIFLRSDYFHSHNWITEVVHSVGVPGGLLYLAMFLAIPWCASPRSRLIATAFATAYAFNHSLWFQLSLSLPMVAMALAALMPPPFPRAIPIHRFIPALTIGLLATAQLLAAAALLSSGLAIGAAQKDLAKDGSLLRQLPVDFRGSDLAIAEVLRDWMWGLTTQSSDTPPSGNSVAAILDFLTARIPHTKTVLLTVVANQVMTQGMVINQPPWLHPLVEARQNSWQGWTEQSLQLAPDRSDLAIGFMTSAAVQGQSSLTEAMTLNILRRNPDDPVGLYFSGLVAVLRPSPEEKARGVALLHRSVDQGLDRYMPIDPQIKALLASH